MSQEQFEMNPNPSGGPIRPCPDCGGTGSGALLVSRRECATCLGGGKVMLVPAGEAVAESVCFYYSSEGQYEVTGDGTGQPGPEGEDGRVG